MLLLLGGARCCIYENCLRNISHVCDCNLVQVICVLTSINSPTTLQLTRLQRQSEAQLNHISLTTRYNKALGHLFFCIYFVFEKFAV